MINTKIPDGTSTTVYRCGPMIDLCVGPHIPHTGRIKSMAITKVRILLDNWISDLILKVLSHRTPHPISSATQTTKRYNESTVSRSQTANK